MGNRNAFNAGVLDTVISILLLNLLVISVMVIDSCIRD